MVLITKEQQQLVLDNMPLVGYVAKKFNPKSRHEYDDLVQQGTIALIDAVKKFNKDKGQLSTLIHVCVYREIRRYLEKNNKIVLAQHYEAPTYNLEQDVGEYCNTLSPVEQKVVLLRTEGHSLASIERLCGKKRNWASKILKRALAKIKETL